MRRFAAAAVATLFVSMAALAEDETTTTTTTTVKKKSKPKESEEKKDDDSSEAPRHSSGGDGANYSIVSARTVGADRNYIHAQLGWPGLVGSFIHGQTDTFDIGGKFGFMWGQEAVNSGYIGLRAQFLMRWYLGHVNIAHFGLEFEPGIQSYFVTAIGSYFGFILPARFTVSFPITSALTLHAGMDLHLTMNFNGGYFFATIPILFGGGVEYVINETISINARFKVGPAIYAGSPVVGFGYVPVGLGIEGMAGVAFRI